MKRSLCNNQAVTAAQAASLSLPVFIVTALLGWDGAIVGFVGVGVLIGLIRVVEREVCRIRSFSQATFSEGLLRYLMWTHCWLYFMMWIVFLVAYVAVRVGVVNAGFVVQGPLLYCVPVASTIVVFVCWPLMVIGVIVWCPVSFSGRRLARNLSRALLFAIIGAMLPGLIQWVSGSEGISSVILHGALAAWSLILVTLPIAFLHCCEAMAKQ